MQNIVTLWSGLEGRRRAILVVAVLGMFAAVFGVARMAAQPDMDLLYSGLENDQAGDVVRALEARGMAYEVRDGAIFVDGARRDELRMTLASEGLPRNGGQGYELLDSLSGFGTTSQMFDAAYWRAKEGELARTIAASPRIDSARVHIAHQGNSPFRRSAAPTASVALTTAGDISGSQAKALRFLVASAVSGLEPENVTIVDEKGELLGTSDESPATGAEDRAETLRARVQRLLEARVGPGNAVVEVSVDTVTERESIRERRFDPETRVAISTDSEERSNTSSNSGNGDVTVASNLPNGDAGGGENSSSQNSETRERVNYEVSETEREILRAPGAVRRLSVAVLINGIAEAGADGASIVTPRDDAELEVLRELVAGAVGFDEARGDTIAIRSMAFEPVDIAGTEAVSPGMFDALDMTGLAQMAVLGLVALLLGLFVVRPVLAAGAVEVGTPTLLPAIRDDELPTEALTGEIADDDFSLPDLPIANAFSGDGGDFPDLASLQASGGEDALERLKQLVEERKEETVEILRSWLEQREEPA